MNGFGTVVFATLLSACCAIAPPITARQNAVRDGYDRLSQINRASLVMLAEEGLVPESLAARIAAGVAQVDEEQAQEGALRSADYLVFEKRLLEFTSTKRHSAGRESETRRTEGDDVDVGRIRVGDHDLFPLATQPEREVDPDAEHDEVVCGHG